MAGRLVYVMGPSGAGKDALLAYARRRLGDSGVVFSHRYITRAPVTGDENFISLSAEEFATRRKLGFFLFDWTAHGTAYGIGREVALWQERCGAVVVSGSRAHFAAAQPAGAVPVLITARSEVMAARLASRGREDEAAIAARLARETPAPRDAIMLDNSGRLEEAGELLIDLLRRLAEESVPAP
jgi:ribose 1,5-bisphosphokinase